MVSIDALMEAAFGPARYERTVNKMRKGLDPLPDLSFVSVYEARDETRDETGAVIGSLRFWPLQLPDGSTEPLLGPLAVNPTLRGLGVGRSLVQHGIDAVKRQGWKGIFIVGDPGYYAPFGFKAECVSGLQLPGPVAPLTFMALDFEGNTFANIEGIVTTRPSITTVV